MTTKPYYEFRERGESGKWITHLLRFESMAKGLEYAQSLGNYAPFQVRRVVEVPVAQIERMVQA